MIEMYVYSTVHPHYYLDHASTPYTGHRSRLLDYHKHRNSCSYISPVHAMEC